MNLGQVAGTNLDSRKGVAAIQRLLVAYDFSDPARRALELAAFLGRRLGAEPHVVTVVEAKGGDGRDNDGSARLEQVRQLLETEVWDQVPSGDRPFVCHALAGDPASEIIALAGELDVPLLVCGTTGKGAIARTLLGSVSHELVERSRAIVMSVP